MELILFILCIASLFVYIFYKAIKQEITADFRWAEEKIIPPYAVLSVKNNEDCIEGIVRSIAQQIRMQTKSGHRCISELVVIDLGSKDSTPLILNKLSAEYEFLRTVSKKQYLESVSKL